MSNILSLKSYYFVLIIICSFTSCKSDSVTTNEITPKNMKDTITYLALGDSYTKGESVATEESYPYLLKDSLAKYKINIKQKVIAQTGWTTDELDNAITAAKIDNQTYDIVSLLIGVNNQYRGRDLATYKKDFIALMQRALKFANNRKDKVFIISIPDYAFTPFGQRTSNPNAISEGIDNFNEINKNVADSIGIQYFYITDITRNGISDPDLVAGDGLHPSAKCYAAWVERIKLKVKEIIEKP
ncbi:MAG: hypothetical protein RLZZ175_2214 [Bacteroidota bacterium]|jgi:acyl-CoA thioesterase-1